MLIKEFGGLPWNLLFKERPDFASGNKVLNCRLEGEEGRYFSDYVLRIDDVEIRNSCLPEYEQEFSYKEGKLYIRERTITDYLQEKDTTLLSYWFMELNKELNKGGAYYSEFEAYIPNPPRDSIITLMDFLNRDFTTSNEEQHRVIVENYKALLLEKIPEKEEDEFFSFFISQKVLKKVDDEHYTLHLGITPGNFRFLSSEAFSHGYISYELKYRELQPLIYMDENEKKLYGLNTWNKGKEAISEEEGRWKPKFLIEIFSKQRG